MTFFTVYSDDSIVIFYDFDIVTYPLVLAVPIGMVIMPFVIGFLFFYVSDRKRDEE